MAYSEYRGFALVEPENRIPWRTTFAVHGLAATRAATIKLKDNSEMPQSIVLQNGRRCGRRPQAAA